MGPCWPGIAIDFFRARAIFFNDAIVQGYELDKTSSAGKAYEKNSSLEAHTNNLKKYTA